MSGEQMSLTIGTALRDAGMALVASNNDELLAVLRSEAYRVARVHGSVHVDDLRAFVLRHHLNVPKNLWGAIFGERKKWRIINYRRSEWSANHGHASPVRVLV